tara:strand:- start:410 stop:1171 length:762 start_codon:yes stop_codon:yes gene_type:complete
MSYNRILADKDYGNYIIDKCYEDEPFKFDQFDSSVEKLKDLIDTRYIDNDEVYRDKKCIVVASGGSVMKSELGDEIDKFDLIVRTNLAKYEGFEKHVGSRTDVRFLSHKTFGNTLPTADFSAYDVDYVPNSNSHLVIRSVGNIGSMIPGFALNQNGKNKFSILDLEYNTYLDKQLKTGHYCTVGFSAVHTMMDLGCKVYIYGFDFYDESTSYHYYEKVSKVAQTGRTNHPMKKEKVYIDYLVNAGKIEKLYGN